jgi:rRNA maturation RNase YbeY
MPEKRSALNQRASPRNSSNKSQSRPLLRLKITATSTELCVSILRAGIIDAHKLLRSPLRELSIVVVPASKMGRIHKQFLNDPSPTDVLTFELEHDSRGRPISGEIVVCSTIARSRAKSLGHPVCHELLLYAIHGLLHLSGFDDRTATGFAAMHAKEDQILTTLGIGPVFFPSRKAR